METKLLCHYIGCISSVTVTCNSSNDPVALCETHISQYIRELPDNTYVFQEPYLPLQVHEQSALLSVRTFLSNTEQVHKEKMLNEHSQRLVNILEELEEATKRQRRELQNVNQAFTSNLKELCTRMLEMRTILAGIEGLGVPTFTSNGFSDQLSVLKKNNKVFTYTDILKEIKVYWQNLEHHNGMSPLSQLIARERTQREEDQPRNPTQINGQLQFTEIKSYSVMTDYVSNIAFSSDGCYYAAGCSDETVKIWNAVNGAPLPSLVGHKDSVRSVAFSPNCRILASGSKDKMIRLWRISDWQAIRLLEGHSDWVYSVTFSKYGEFIASGSRDMTIKLWNSRGDLLNSFLGHMSGVYSVSFSYDDQYLASGSADKTIRIWDVATGDVKGTLSSHCDWVYSVCFAKSSLLLVSGSDDNTVKLWDVENREVICTFRGHSDWVSSVVFSPDDQFIASGSGDKTIKLWRVSNKSLIATLKQHFSFIRGIEFSPDGLALASRDETEFKLVSLL